MKIQSLAVMFIILILPISLVLASYTQNRVETLSLQATCDSKLDDATYDALKAYQLNSFNSDTSDLTNSKMRDINASVNTFFNSMSTSFSSLGYTKETLQNYVPALVYTMYDGYYIYSPYTNTWDTETIDKYQSEYQTFSNGQKLYGLKPYVYYSCRYKKSDIDADIVITYSLDNYIQIQGTIGGKTVSKYGYLLSDLKKNGDSITYKGVEISTENQLTENIYVDGKYKKNVPYIKKNGVKYYTEDRKNVYYVLNGKSMPQSTVSAEDIYNNENAKKYYEEAFDLQKFIIDNKLDKLTTKDIVNADKSQYYQIEGTIFNFDEGENIEEKTSNFNTHRVDVIKHSIERNLSVAISNFNNYSGVTTDFQMPKLKDFDWDKIMDNISIISFLQGMNIGGKVYNGYSIITNTKNEDIVMEDSIYIKTTSDNVLHRVKEKGLDIKNGAVGIYNINLERRSAQDNAGNTRYYFPLSGTLSYDSIVTQDNVSDDELTDYLKKNPNLAQIFYTALGRERYSLYRPKLEI